MAKLQDWVNYGDVNPLEHGGMWIREEAGSEGKRYEFIKLQEWFDEHVAIFFGVVDLEDDWIDWEAVGNYADTKEASNEHKVMGAVDYYGCAEFQSFQPEYIEVGTPNTEKAVRSTLGSFGILLK